jgi:hypothetical protein
MRLVLPVRAAAQQVRAARRSLRSGSFPAAVSACRRRFRQLTIGPIGHDEGAAAMVRPVWMRVRMRA